MNPDNLSNWGCKENHTLYWQQYWQFNICWVALLMYMAFYLITTQRVSLQIILWLEISILQKISNRRLQKGKKSMTGNYNWLVMFLRLQVNFHRVFLRFFFCFGLGFCFVFFFVRVRNYWKDWKRGRNVFVTIWTILGYDNMEDSPKRPVKAYSRLVYAARWWHIINSDVCLNFWCYKLVFNRSISRINLPQNQTGI